MEEGSDQPRMSFLRARLDIRERLSGGRARDVGVRSRAGHFGTVLAFRMVTSPSPWGLAQSPAEMAGCVHLWPGVN